MKTALGHEYYKTGDADIPAWLKDLVGSPLFPVCRTCGGFDADLRFTCPGEDGDEAADTATASPGATGTPLEAANNRLYKMKFQFEHSPAVIGMNEAGSIYMSGKFTADEMRQILEIIDSV